MATFICIFCLIVILAIAAKIEDSGIHFKQELAIISFIYLIEFWKRSFDFRGTTTRRTFWITQAWLLIKIIILVLLGICLFLDINHSTYVFYGLKRTLFNNDVNVMPYIFLPIYAYSIVTLIPSISLQVRRLRDAAKNPWWILISFVPFIGGIVLLIFYLSPSRKKRLPMTLQDRLSEVEDLLKKGTIDEEEYKYMRKKILTKYVD